MKNQIGSCGQAYVLISFNVSGITFEIFAGSELSRVDEVAYYDSVIFRCGSFYQASVTFVQKSHGRDQADGQAVRTPFSDLLPYFFYRLYCIHMFTSQYNFFMMSSSMAKVCSGAGKEPSLTSLMYSAKPSFITFPPSAKCFTNFGLKSENNASMS